jgi:pyridoxine 5-phosphate synthase
MLLGVNIDHIASLRQLRKGKDPDPIKAAKMVLANGADSIVIHLREDRRHIQDKDLVNLKKVIKNKLNLEMSIDKKIVAIACKVKPQQVTLVPERRRELTTEGGLNVAGKLNAIKSTVKELNKHGIKVSLFIDPEFKQIKAAKESGASLIELHTGKYANSKNKTELKNNLEELKNAVFLAINLGLKVNAGHGLDYKNVRNIAKITGIKELNIGYSIICRALFMGLNKAVSEMHSLITS